MQRKYSAFPRTSDKSAPKTANSLEKGRLRLLIIPYFLTSLLALAGVALVVASEMGAMQ